MASESAVVFRAMIIGSPMAARMEATRPSSGSFQPLMSISTTSGRMRSRRSRKLPTSPMSWCSTMMRNGKLGQARLGLLPELAVLDGQSDGQRIHCESPGCAAHLLPPPGGAGRGAGVGRRGAGAMGMIWKRRGPWARDRPAPASGPLPVLPRGIVSDGGFTGTGPVLSIPGCAGAGLRSRMEGDFEGHFGRGCPAGTGRTTSGVMITSSSVFLRLFCRLWNSLPSIGMSPMPGTLEKVSVMWLSSSPAMAKLCPLSSSTSVFTLRLRQSRERSRP